MNVATSRKFDNDIDKLDAVLALRILQVIDIAMCATTIQDIPNIRKMKGYTSAYRIKVGDYRIGLELSDNDTVKLHRVLHRSRIYTEFP